MPPATTFRSAQNDFPSTLTGGTVPAANQKPAFAGWANSVDPVDTPVLSAIKKSKVVDQRTFFWGQSKFPAVRSTLAAPINTTVTSITVAAGDGVFFQKYDVINIIDIVPGSSPPRMDYTSKETVWVSADPVGDALTIVRAQGGSPPLSHSVSAMLEIIGTAEPQLQDHVISPVTRGWQYSNYMQRFGGSIKMDSAFRNTSTYEYEGDQLMNDVRNETKRLKLLLERAVIAGGKQQGNPSTPLPELMGGFLTFITTNIYNQGGSTLSASGLETAMRDMYKKVEDGSPRMWVMGPDTAAIFDTFLNPYRQATMSETQATFTVTGVKLRWGTYDIMVSRWMPEGIIAMVNWGNMTLVTFKGLDWHTSVQPVYGDYAQMSISTDKSLQVENEVGMGLITNFITDLDQYPGRTFLS
jgi:hypothetical protein